MPYYRRYKRRRSYRRPNYGRARVRYARGRGDYSFDNPGPWGTWGRRIGGAIGRQIGQPYGYTDLGTRIGGRLGSYAHYIGKMFGSGAYYTSRGSRKSATGGKRTILAPPKIEFESTRDYVEITKRDYIGDIVSSAVAGDFKVDSYPIQPGSPQTFPWLSAIAGANYQSYSLEQCMFEFKSSSGNALNSTNSALGIVVAAINYDSNDPPYESRFQMENTSWSQSNAPSADFVAPVECKKSQTFSQGHLYIRHGAPPAGSDIKTYDIGKFSIATQGLQGTSVNVGSLYIVYKVRLYKPVVLRPLSIAYYFHLRIATGVSAANPLGQANTSVATYSIAIFNNMNATWDNDQITFDRTYLRPGMRFTVQYFAVGSGATMVPPNITPTNMAGVAMYNNSTETTEKAGTATIMLGVYAFQCISSAANSVLLFSGGTYGTMTQCDVIVQQVNPGANT